MKALVFGGPGQRAWSDEADPTASSTPPTRSSASTPSPSAAPTCTSSAATCPRCSRAGSSATRPSARSSRPARRHAPSGPATGCWPPASPPAAAAATAGSRRYGQCLGGGGWILGHLIDGVQAQYARHAVRRPVDVPAAPQRVRRGGRPAGRHPAHLLRGRRAQRHGPSRRHRRRGRRRPDRAGRDPDRPAVLPGAHHRRRQGGQPAAGRQAARRGRAGHARRGPAGGGRRGHRRARRRRGDGGRRHPGDLRAVHHAWSVPAAGWPTSACTASPPRCTSKTCGSATSPSRPAWSTPTPRRRC